MPTCQGRERDCEHEYCVNGAAHTLRSEWEEDVTYQGEDEQEYPRDKGVGEIEGEDVQEGRIVRSPLERGKVAPPARR